MGILRLKANLAVESLQKHLQHCCFSKSNQICTHDFYWSQFDLCMSVWGQNMPLKNFSSIYKSRCFPRKTTLFISLGSYYSHFWFNIFQNTVILKIFSVASMGLIISVIYKDLTFITGDKIYSIFLYAHVAFNSRYLRHFKNKT